jgi:acetolactate synthase-1/2/3 large subunit
MIKVSDFIFRYLVEKYGIRYCFLVTGGGAMHLDDSIGHTKGLKYICNHHEQASAMAGEGYYRTCGRLSVTCVTTGPGGTNAITGVLGQYLDSIPGLYISGQIKTSTYKNSYPDLKLRQLGDQEADIVAMVTPITKYAKTIYDPLDVKYELDKAITIALDGRPGPVWLDIPLDVQGAYVDEMQFREFNPALEIPDTVDHALVDQQIRQLKVRIKAAKSPVIYVGNGVRLAKREKEFIRLAEKLHIPVVTAISGSDLIWHDHPLFFGKPGICGDRIGNIMVQNSDLLMVMGTRLSIRQIGYAYDLLAPKAFKVMVDIDTAEMQKPTLKIDMPVQANLSEFIDKMLASLEAERDRPDFEDWIAWGRDIAGRIPTLFDDNPDCDGYANSYRFADELFRQLHAGDVVVTGNGTAYTCTYQAMKVNQGVRVFANQGCAAMGYGLPASIGACVANEGGRTICITGDGSIQMNIQELQTIVTYRLPLKVFVLENESYLAIKTTQKAFFSGRYTGSNPASGVVCPDLKRMADAYGIPFVRVSSNDALASTISDVLHAEGAMICEVRMHPEQTLFPKSASFMDPETGRMTSAPLEKMAPFMSDELQRLCIYLPDMNPSNRHNG